MGITQTAESPNLQSQTERVSQMPNFVTETDNISFTEWSCLSCVGIIDIVNSTRITAGLSRSQMSKYYCLFINWASAVVKGYGGTVVKNTGDGLLFYFPLLEAPQNERMIRGCLNCGIAMSNLQPSINLKFLSESLPQLNYRISLDYGEISLARTADAAVPDIFSTTVNICAKINRIALPNTIVVGGDMYQISKNLSGFSFEESKKTISISDRPYSVYSVTESKTVLEHLRSLRSARALKEPQNFEKVADKEMTL